MAYGYGHTHACKRNVTALPGFLAKVGPLPPAAEVVNDALTRLYFAGEATSETDSYTVHGAFQARRPPSPTGQIQGRGMGRRRGQANMVGPPRTFF